MLPSAVDRRYSIKRLKMKTFKYDESSLSEATESPSPKCILKQIIKTEPVSEPLVKNKSKPFEDLFSNAEKSRFRFKTPHIENIGGNKFRKSEVNIQPPALALKTKIKKPVEKSSVKLSSTVARLKKKTFNCNESSISDATENHSSRYIPKQIIQTEPVSDLLVISKPRRSKPPPLSDLSPYVEKSGLRESELSSLASPDLSTVDVTAVVQRMKQKRPFKRKSAFQFEIKMKDALQQRADLETEGQIPGKSVMDQTDENELSILASPDLSTVDITAVARQKKQKHPLKRKNASQLEIKMKDSIQQRAVQIDSEPEGQIPGRSVMDQTNSKSCVRKSAQSENRKKSRCIEKQYDLPKSVVLSTFSHFARTKVSKDVYPILQTCVGKYFDRLADDLSMYVHHAKRKTVEMADLELLMKRQGFVTEKTPLNVLIEKHLTLEYRKLLIPVASSGNKVTPNI